MKKKKILVYILLVIIGVTVVDVVFRFIFTPFFYNPSINTKAGATYKFASCNEPAELVILGASRATHHYRSKQLEDSLGISVYNYGGDGRCTLYQYLCLIKAIANGGIKTVILDLSTHQIGNEWVNDRISDLYPYYWNNDTVRMMVNEVEKRDMRLFMLSSLIQYNSQYLNLIAPMNSEKGYIPIPYTGIPLDTAKRANPENVKLDENHFSKIGVKYLSRIVSLCKTTQIDLIICLSPSLDVYKSNEYFLDNLCRRYDVKYWNMTHMIEDPILFGDYNHLNDKGAELFTKEIIQRLKYSCQN